MTTWHCAKGWNQRETSWRIQWILYACLVATKFPSFSVSCHQHGIVRMLGLLPNRCKELGAVGLWWWVSVIEIYIFIFIYLVPSTPVTPPGPPLSPYRLASIPLSAITPTPQHPYNRQAFTCTNLHSFHQFWPSIHTAHTQERQLFHHLATKQRSTQLIPFSACLTFLILHSSTPLHRGITPHNHKSHIPCIHNQHQNQHHSKHLGSHQPHDVANFPPESTFAFAVTHHAVTHTLSQTALLTNQDQHQIQIHIQTPLHT